MRNAALATAFSATVLLGAASCSGSDEDGTRRRLAEDLVRETDGRLDRDTADCVAAGLDEEFGDRSFEEVLDAAAGRGAGREDAVRMQVIDIFSECDALGEIADATG